MGEQEQINRARTHSSYLQTFLFMLLMTATAIAGDELSPRMLANLAKDPASPKFREALVAALHDAEIKKGTAWLGESSDFVWAVETEGQPALILDGKPGPAMLRVPNANLWYAFGQVAPLGKLHYFHYLIGGQKFGGLTDLPAFTSDSYARAGVPQGKLSEKKVFTSKIYDGMICDYWIYVPAQYDPKTPAALMVWQDGKSYIDRNSPVTRILDAIDNLIAQKKIPVMIGVFISPGDIEGAPDTETYRFVKAYAEKYKRTMRDSMRSVEYDTVSDRYVRLLRDEILAEVESQYNIRKDAYSRGITGLSSGGICAFNVAWQQPEQFSRVISWIGSYAAIQWHPGMVDGGNVYPNKVRLEPKRNIRVWLQGGTEDLENIFGSWPLQNIQLANSLKMHEYDFHFSFAHGSHNPAHGSAEFPEEMTWLWRNYDPAKIAETYEMDPAEKSKQYFRVTSLNRAGE